MYAIVKINGKQHVIKDNEILKVDRVKTEVDGSFEIEDVLAIGEENDLDFGNPTVAGAKVKFKVLEHRRAKTIRVFKKKRRKGYEVSKGHRQPISVLKVEEIIK